MLLVDPSASCGRDEANLGCAIKEGTIIWLATWNFDPHSIHLDLTLIDLYYACVGNTSVNTETYMH